MEIAWHSGYLLAGLVLLYFGAEWLVRGSSSLALRLGVSPLVAGLTVVAYGTSMPEFVVSIKASLSGQSGLALGNIVGSNIFNTALILGIASLIQPLKVNFRVVRIDIPIMLAVTVACAVILRTGRMERWMGGILVVCLIVYTVWQIHASLRNKTPEVEKKFAGAVPPPSSSPGRDIVYTVVGIAVLALGGRWLVDGSVGIARFFGISETIIGLTIVAAGTSAPELAATIVAAIRKEADIAVGNVVGSNIFNILCVGGFASLIHPLDASQITPMDIGMLLLISFLILPLAWSHFVLKRWEGALLLVLFGGYMYLLWPE